LTGTHLPHHDRLINRGCSPFWHWPLGRHALLLKDPIAIGRLLDALRQAGAADQAEVLTDRLPAEGLFGLFREQGNRQAHKFGREPGGRPAAVWSWDDLD
jgi:hypothetical protein